MRMKIEDLLRRAIKKSGETRYQIAQKTGIAEAQLCRFMQGKTLRLPAIETLLEYFGYELRRKANYGTPKANVHTEKRRRHSRKQDL